MGLKGRVYELIFFALMEGGEGLKFPGEAATW